MVQGSFELSNNNFIKIKGKSFDLNAFKDLNDILQKLICKNKIKDIDYLSNEEKEKKTEKRPFIYHFRLDPPQIDQF